MGALQIPDDRGQQNDGRVGEEVALFLRPALIEVQQDDVGAFVSVRYVGHKPNIEGVAAVRTPGVVEIDDAELRPHGIPVLMPQQVVVGDRGKVVELVIVDVKRIPLFDALTDVTVDDGIALSRVGRSEDHHRAEGIDDIDPSLPPLRLITITRRKVHRIIIAEATLFLKKTFVFIIERIVGKRLFQQAPQPDPGGQQAEIPHSKGRNIAPCPKVGSGRQLQQRAVQKEQREAEADGGDDMPPVDPAVADALRAVAAKREEQKGAEFRNVSLRPSQ